MRKFFVLAILVLALVGCKNFEDLEAGNKLALENQKNLEANTIRAFDNLKKVGQAYAKAANKEWTADDDKKWEAQKNEAATQLAINRAWLLVIEEAIKQDSLNANFFSGVLTKLPDWIKQGKDIYDLIKSLQKK
jgi:hypothetical protein